MELLLGGIAAFPAEVLVLSLWAAPRWPVRKLTAPARCPSQDLHGGPPCGHRQISARTAHG